MIFEYINNTQSAIVNNDNIMLNIFFISLLYYIFDVFAIGLGKMLGKLIKNNDKIKINKIFFNFFNFFVDKLFLF